LAAVERAQKKQASRITNLKLGDANTSFFHRRVNTSRRKNHIQRLKNGRGWAVTHEEKVSVIQTHFDEIMDVRRNGPPTSTGIPSTLHNMI
jgi:hypothetical protein